jgi:hypothetical protein
MGATLVATAAASSLVEFGSPATTAARNTTGANFICVACNNYDSEASELTLTDTIGGNPSGNVWTLVPYDPTNPGVAGFPFFYYMYNPAVGANHVFSLASTGNADPNLCMMAFSGVPLGSISADYTTTPISASESVSTLILDFATTGIPVQTQSVSFGGGGIGTSGSGTFANPIPVGQSIVVVFQNNTFFSTSGVMTLTDSSGNVYSHYTAAFGTNPCSQVDVFVAFNVPATSSLTLNWTAQNSIGNGDGEAWTVTNLTSLNSFLSNTQAPSTGPLTSPTITLASYPAEDWLLLATSYPYASPVDNWSNMDVGAVGGVFQQVTTFAERDESWWAVGGNYGPMPSITPDSGLGFQVPNNAGDLIITAAGIGDIQGDVVAVDSGVTIAGSSIPYSIVGITAGYLVAAQGAVSCTGNITIDTVPSPPTAVVSVVNTAPFVAQQTCTGFAAMTLNGLFTTNNVATIAVANSAGFTPGMVVYLNGFTDATISSYLNDRFGNVVSVGSGVISVVMPLGLANYSTLTAGPGTISQVVKLQGFTSTGTNNLDGVNNTDKTYVISIAPNVLTLAGGFSGVVSGAYTGQADGTVGIPVDPVWSWGTPSLTPAGNLPTAGYPFQSILSSMVNDDLHGVSEPPLGGYSGTFTFIFGAAPGNISNTPPGAGPWPPSGITIQWQGTDAQGYPQVGTMNIPQSALITGTYGPFIIPAGAFHYGIEAVSTSATNRRLVW